MAKSAKSTHRSELFPVAAIFVLSLAAVLPLCFFGNASGHDFEFHLCSWMEVVHQWRQGIVYPRWAELANYGFGEPRFIFYPPVSWLLGAALSRILPWRMVPGAYVWLCLSLAGLSMFLLARGWLSHGEAVAAALLYAINPYHFVVVYWRSAFAELFADAIFPLMLLFAVRCGESRRAIVPLALLVAATWLTDAPAAVMVIYAMALLLTALAFLKRSSVVLARGAVAVGLGMALAAFYILPAAFEQRWVEISQAISTGLRPQDNFLFTWVNDPEHNLVNLRVSAIAILEIGMAALAALFSRRLRRSAAELFWSLLALGTLSALLMFSVTNSLWLYVPKLQYVQIPWRWLFPLNASVALLLVAALSKIRLRALWGAALALVFLGTAAAVLYVAPWDPDAVSELQSDIQKNQGYEGTDEYSPLSQDRYDLPQLAPQIEIARRFALQPHAPEARQSGMQELAASIAQRPKNLQIERWTAESRVFTLESAVPLTVTLKLLKYPAWKTYVNGTQAPTYAAETAGPLKIDLAAGLSHVEVKFTRTKDRLAGGELSLLCAAFLLLLKWSDAHNG